MPKNTAEGADLLRRFAKAHGVSERSARNYRRDPRRGNKPRKEWVDFCRAEGRAVADDAAAPLAPAATAVSPLARARVAEETAWNTLARLQGLVTSCDNVDQLPALSAAVKNARKAWEEARVDREHLEEVAGHLIPRAVLGQIKMTLIPRLSDAWRNHQNNVASRLRPDARPDFFNAWRASTAAWDEAIKALDKELEKYTHA